MNKLYIMDTNILCCYLQIPGKETVGNGDKWDLEKINKKITEIEKEKHSIVIPLPMMIELGNQIGHEKNRDKHKELEKLINKTIDNKAPFHSFNQQKNLWEDKNLRIIISKWEDYLFQESEILKNEKKKGLGLGDIFVIALASYFKMGLSGPRYDDVEIWSADNGILALKDIEFFDDINNNKRKSRN